MARPRVAVPAAIRSGQTIEVRTLIQHPMETGYRRDGAGAPIPRDILRRFVATYEGRTVFEAELFPAVAANPYLAFSLRAGASGVLTLAWTDDAGATTVETVRLAVT